MFSRSEFSRHPSSYTKYKLEFIVISQIIVSKETFLTFQQAMVLKSVWTKIQEMYESVHPDLVLRLHIVHMHQSGNVAKI